jgi:hypothetical protein
MRAVGATRGTFPGNRPAVSIAGAFDGSELGRFEFLYGCVAEPPAGWPHGRLDVTPGHRLMSHVESAGLGLVFGSSQGFALPSGDTVAPDAAVVLRGTWEAPTRACPFRRHAAPCFWNQSRSRFHPSFAASGR